MGVGGGYSLYEILVKRPSNDVSQERVQMIHLIVSPGFIIGMGKDQKFIIWKKIIKGVSDLLPHERVVEKLQNNTPEGQITETKDVKFIIRKIESPKELSNDILHEVIGNI